MTGWRLLNAKIYATTQFISCNAICHSRIDQIESIPTTILFNLEVAKKNINTKILFLQKIIDIEIIYSKLTQIFFDVVKSVCVCIANVKKNGMQQRTNTFCCLITASNVQNKSQS